MTASALRSWVQPLEVKNFLDHYWTQTYFWSNPDQSRLRFTEDLLPSLELPVLLEYADEPVRVWYRDGEKPVYSLELGRKEAFHAYRAGLILYFHLNPSYIGDLVTQLAQALERPPFTIKASIFASKAGGETMPHFDGCENFTIHLQGKKRWRISPGEDWPEIQKLEQPEFFHNFFSRRKPPSSWNQVQPLEMTPGSFLYCPAHYWHTVETIEDSLSFNVSVAQSYTWADALLPVIRAILMQSKEWRSPNVGLWATGGEERERALESMRQLLKRMSYDLDNINMDDILAAWTPPKQKTSGEILTPSFIRNPFVSCEIVSTVPDTEFRFCTESRIRPGNKQFLTMEWKYYLPFLALVGDRRIKYAEQFADVPDLVSQLLFYGVLRPYNVSHESS